MKKVLSAITVIAVCLALFAGCSTARNDQPETQPPAQAEETALSGTINLGGSTSVEGAVVAVMDEFLALNPEVDGKYDATGSSVGMTNAIDGTYHLGFSSRTLKDEETAAGLKQQTFALDGIAVAVNPANSVQDLTLAQLKDIFTGKIKNWKEVGGEDAKIVVVSREAGSGTRGAFEELVDFEDALTADASIKDGNGNVATYIGEEKNAIGYISFVTLEENQDKVRGMKIEGVDASVENVLNETYKISRPFIVAYMETNLNEAEIAFVDFLMSDEGQAIIEEKGAISVK